jgi:NAD(P)-dependent dehydrogenase (short-subunit alcohol dehydrogenase family)
MILSPLLKDKVALITGASRGIGAATARLFAQAGARVVLAARSEADLKAVAESIKAQGGHALAVPTDITNPQAVDDLVAQTVRQFHGIDILVNNAALLTPIGKSWQVDPKAWRTLLDVNVNGAFLCTRAVLPDMLERGSGRVLNITSGAADKAVSGWSAYCASKAALNHFTQVLAEEISHTEIVACAVNPGVTDTAMQSQIRRTQAGQFEKGDYYRQLYEEERLFKPEEPAQLLLWLASKFGHAQNGAILDLADDGLRQQVAQDLGLPLIPNRRAE